MHTTIDYTNAIKFALNNPIKRDIPISHSYNEDNDIFKVVDMDGGWVNFKLNGFYVRSCLKWRGIKQWKQ